MPSHGSLEKLLDVGQTDPGLTGVPEKHCGGGHCGLCSAVVARCLLTNQRLASEHRA